MRSLRLCTVYSVTAGNATPTPATHQELLDEPAAGLSLPRASSDAGSEEVSGQVEAGIADPPAPAEPTAPALVAAEAEVHDAGGIALSEPADPAEDEQEPADWTQAEAANEEQHVLPVGVEGEPPAQVDEEALIDVVILPPPDRAGWSTVHCTWVRVRQFS